MIGVIGCGNMAEAIVKGFSQKFPKIEFLTYTPSFTGADTLAKQVNGKAVKALIELQAADTIVIACKPQQLNDLADNINKAGLDLKQKHIISILAATPLQVLESRLGATKITRVMPNTPSLIGLGMSLIMHSKAVTKKERELVDDFFNACGEVQKIETEEMFDKVTTVSGSGPAYVFLFAKTMADQLSSWGLSPEDSKEIVIQLFRGSSELMNSQKELSLDELISKVTSKGGVTIEAVESYRGNGLEGLTQKALSAAVRRSNKMTVTVESLKK